MNQEELGISIGRKRGPIKGRPQETERMTMWNLLLGPHAKEIIDDAHRDIQRGIDWKAMAKEAKRRAQRRRRAK